MKQMQKNGIVSVIKHFPGHGATKKDSHYGLPKIARKIEKLDNTKLNLTKSINKIIENNTNFNGNENYKVPRKIKVPRFIQKYKPCIHFLGLDKLA